jgi:histidinol-phosphate aminotransferase
MQYERKNISAMQGYVSGEQPEGPGIIKLNTNENPYPPGPAVARALAGITVEQLRRYPPPTALALRQSLAALHQLDVDNLVVTNGGDELLRLLLATFVEPGQSIAVAEPSYSLYEVLAAAHGAEVRRIPLETDWSLPVDFAAQLNASGASLCFVVNPHAPSGTLTNAATLRELARQFRGVLVIDEAYVDFVDPELGHDCLPLIGDCDNLVLLRTFSKGYSLAGLRMAYGIGARGLIDPMQYKTKDSYNTDFIAQTLARAAIEDHAYAANTWRLVREERSRLREALAQRGLNSPPSQTNFLLATVPPPHDARDLYEGLKQAGILVRHFRISGIEDKLRITIGTAEENERLLAALDRLL